MQPMVAQRHTKHSFAIIEATQTNRAIRHRDLSQNCYGSRVLYVLFIVSVLFIASKLEHISLMDFL